MNWLVMWFGCVWLGICMMKGMCMFFLVEVFLNSCSGVLEILV